MFLVAGDGGGRGHHSLPVLPVQGGRVDGTVNLGPRTVEDAVGQLHVVDDRHDGVVVMVLHVARAAHVHHQAGARVGHGRGTDRGLVILKHRLLAAEEKQRPLRGECLLRRGGGAGGRLPVSSQPARRNVRLVAGAADERPFVVMEPLVKFEVNILCESGGALITCVWLLARVKTHVGLQI